MAASATKRKLVLPQSAPNSDINVTPLVDVVLVLLIIFMVVTPLLEKDIEIRLPETEEQTEPPPEDNQQVVVTLDPAGTIAINNTPISVEEYVPKLKRMMAAKAKADRVVFFMPDDKSNYGKLISAVDGAKAAGAEILGMVTEPPPAAAAGTEAAPVAAPVTP
ncbi:MAG: biopolymer transporter ExbD [Myxococcaceae bacterium]|nr:biopolymer transporter ExbD [Myxococcaceae bacterium]